MGLADIHIHLLFGVDDGAKDEDEMHAILDAAYQAGTRVLCCTPHFHPGYFGDNYDKVFLLSYTDFLKAISKNL